MRASCSSIVVLSLVLSFAPAFATSGTVPDGSNSEAIVDDIIAPWSGVLGCLKDLCGDPCDIIFFATSGGCLNVQTRLRINVNTIDGELSEDYNWEVVPTCVPGPSIDIGFQACPGNTGSSGACGALVTLTPGQTQSFGEIDVTATRINFSSGGPTSIPTIPRWGLPVLGAALVGAALFFIVRRSR